MAYVEKELEEELMESGNRLLAPPSSAEELLPLLDQAETFLSRVEQSPSQTMSSALRPVMKALVAEELLGHSNIDVKVAVASCISEITRITAPDAPYDDDVMKVIFQMIVQAFENLDDASDHSYRKRVSILETVAKVRSCVVMLDLECDDLILEMFHHFLGTIRDNHPENVFSSMETIMTLVLEESEEMSSEILSCLLLSVKKDNKDVLPIARRLGEKVITNCKKKLKPCLMEVVQSMGAPLTDYGKIVSSICQEDFDGLEHNDVNASSECLGDDSKLSERTVSDELPQGSVKTEMEIGCPEEVVTAADKSPRSEKMETEVGCPEEIGTDADKSPKSVMNNGTAQIGNDDCFVEPTSPNEKTERSHRRSLSKNTSASSRAEKDNLDSLTVKIDKASDHNTKKTRGRKVNSSIQSADTINHPRIDSDKEAVGLSNRRKGRAKDADGSLHVSPSSKVSETSVQLINDKKIKQQPLIGPDIENVCVASPTTNESLRDASRPKRGRPSASKMLAKKGAVHVVADLPTSPSGPRRASMSEQTEDVVPSPHVSKKKTEGISDSEAKPPRRSAKRVRAENANDSETPIADIHSKKEVEEISDSEAKLLRQTGKRTYTGKGDSSGKQRTSKTKQPKGNFASEKDVTGERSLKVKQIVSAPKSSANADKGQSHLEHGLMTKSRRKRVHKIPEMDLREGRMDETLVGSKIKVWWPDDKKFYHGTVDAFDPVSKKHTVVYVDGDVEILLLKNELWCCVEGDTSADEQEAEDLPSLDISEKPSKKKGKKKSDSTLKQAKLDEPIKSGGTSAGKSRSSGTEDGGKRTGEPVKSAGSRKGGISKPEIKCDDTTLTPGSISMEKTGSNSKDDTPKTARKPKEGSGNKSKVDTRKTAGEAKDDPSKTGKKSKDDTPKLSSKSKDGSSKSGSKLKDETPKTGMKIKDDTIPTNIKSKANVTKAGSKPKEDTSKAGLKPKDINTPRTGSKTDANGTSRKRKSVASTLAEGDESDAKVNASSVKVQGGAKSGKKRRRKA